VVWFSALCMGVCTGKQVQEAILSFPPCRCLVRGEVTAPHQAVSWALLKHQNTSGLNSPHQNGAPVVLPMALKHPCHSTQAAGIHAFFSSRTCYCNRGNVEAMTVLAGEGNTLQALAVPVPCLPI